MDPADLPPGVDHDLANEVLSHYLAGGESTDVNNLGSTLNLAERTVIEILRSPFAVAIIAAIRELANQRADVLAAESRTEAIYVTRRIAVNSRSDEIARRAANALLNFRTYVPPPPRAASPAPAPTTPGTPGVPPPAAQRRVVPGPSTTPTAPTPSQPTPRSIPAAALTFPTTPAPSPGRDTTRAPAPHTPTTARPSTPAGPAAPTPTPSARPPAANPSSSPHHPLPSSPSQARPHLTFTPNPPPRASPPTHPAA